MASRFSSSAATVGVALASSSALLVAAACGSSDSGPGGTSSGGAAGTAGTSTGGTAGTSTGGTAGTSTGGTAGTSTGGTAGTSTGGTAGTSTGGSGGAPPDSGDDAAPTAPISAPAEQWTWVELPGMKCGNGQPTGVGINLTTRSDDVMMFVQGGGACWDANSCFVVKSAVNIESGYGAAQFAVESATLGYNRNPGSPFADATWVYVPYCTGDLHAGQRVATYTTLTGARDVHHVGGVNFDVLLPRLHATRPNARTVWAIGVSAGGYGVTLNWAAFRSTFTGAAVHILADSSPPVAMEAARWAAMKTEWDLRQPSGCSTCADSLDQLPPFYRSTVPATNRYGLLSYTHDATIAAYFGVSATALETAEKAVQTGMTAGSGQAAFLIDGTSHVMLADTGATTSSGKTLPTFLAGWILGTADFVSGGP